MTCNSWNLNKIFGLDPRGTSGGSNGGSNGGTNGGSPPLRGANNGTTPHGGEVSCLNCSNR